MASKKKKLLGLGVAGVIALLIALLEAVPHIKAAIEGDTKPLAEFGKSKLGELQDAGIIAE